MSVVHSDPVSHFSLRGLSGPKLCARPSTLENLSVLVVSLHKLTRTLIPRRKSSRESSSLPRHPDTLCSKPKGFDEVLKLAT